MFMLLAGVLSMGNIDVCANDNGEAIINDRSNLNAAAVSTNSLTLSNDK